MLAGRYDALALLGASSGAAAALPLLAGSPLAAPALAASAAGVAWLGYKGLSRKADQALYATRRKDFILPSDQPPPRCAPHQGYRLGWTTDTHQPVDLTDELAVRHLAIIGQSGVGKTVMGQNLLWGQTARGGGWGFVDAKIDRHTRDQVGFMARSLGREHDFLLLDPTDVANSNTYNPVLRGTGDEVASRLLALLPVAENNPGADHYRQAANYALSVIISGLQAANMAYHFGDLAILLQSSRALDDLRIRATNTHPTNHSAVSALNVFLDQYRTFSKDTGATVDVKRLKETLGGMAGRIATFAQGEFGAVMNHCNPEIDLFDVIANNRMLYIMLPTMSKGTAALNLGKMLVSDWRTATAKVQDLPIWRRPNPPFLSFFDEMGSYVIYDVKTLFEQARNARMCMIPAFQSFANLSVVTEDFADIIIQNTWTKALFKFGSREAEEAAELVGKRNRYSESFSEGDNLGASAPLLRATPQQQQSDGTSQGTSYRQVEDYRISADQFRAMSIGRCGLIMGADLYHMRTAQIRYPEPLPQVRAIRRQPGIPRKLEPAPYAANYNSYLTVRESEIKAAEAKQAQKNMDDEAAPVLRALDVSREADA